MRILIEIITCFLAFRFGKYVGTILGVHKCRYIIEDLLAQFVIHLNKIRENDSDQMAEEDIHWLSTLDKKWNKGATK